MTSGRICGTSFLLTHVLVRLALHVDSFDADAVRARCMPWLLDPLSFLQGCSRSRHDAVCSVLAAFVSLVEASVADDAVPLGSCVFASGLVRRSLCALALSPASHVAERCPLLFRSAGGADYPFGLRRGPRFGFFPFLHLPAPLPPTAVASRRLRDSLRSQTSSAWQAALAP
jgi:hypothetical protein